MGAGEGNHLDSNNSAVPFSIGHELIQSTCTYIYIQLQGGPRLPFDIGSLVYSAVQLH